jgi:alpha-glucosidase
MVQTTRGQQLAKYVVYDSPLQMRVRRPGRLCRDGEGFDFVRKVPADWDETRFLAGDTGQGLRRARPSRKGKDWFVGAMTNETDRTIQVPLAFLGEGQFKADVWQDGPKPTDIGKTQRAALKKTDTVTLRLAANGGGAIHLSPTGGSPP